MNKTINNNYFIEFRFQGKSKIQIKKLIYDIDEKCKLNFIKNKRPVPHITLVAPFKSTNQNKIVSMFNNICSQTNVMNFKVEGFDVFEKEKVVYLSITPSNELKKFRWKLSKSFSEIVKLKLSDYDKNYYFHSTLALKLNDKKFKQVQNYVKNKNLPKFKHSVIRATLIKNNLILREYDFLLNKSLNRNQAKSKDLYYKSIKLLINYIENKPKSLMDRLRSVFK